jgi:hypothetical protein
MQTNTDTWEICELNIAFLGWLCNNYYMGTRARSYETATAALRDAITSSEHSFKALERMTDVKRQSMMKFVVGEQSLRLDVADKLLVYFGFEIVRRKVN